MSSVCELTVRGVGGQTIAYFGCVTQFLRRSPMIFCQSGWWTWATCHYNPPPLFLSPVAGSADDRARMSESIVEMPFAGRRVGQVASLP
jgi:hypothetical protein